MTISFQERVATLKVKPSLPDARDHIMFAASPGQLPTQADLGVTVPIKDQGRQGSCTGHGFASMREALDALHALPHVDYSRAFIYAMERMLESTLDQDAGAQPADGCKVLQKNGVCWESTMPYSDQVFNVAPSDQQLENAQAAVIGNYARVLGSGGVKQATVMHRPVGFGIAVYESFEHIGADGIVPMPQPGERLLGGHWVFGNAKGYIDDASVPGGGFVTGQNSWGTGWGEGGYMHFPYAYLDNPNLTFEMRAVWL